MEDDEVKERFQSVIQALNECRSEDEKKEKLLDLGFEFFEDDEPDSDIDEEQKAKANTEREHCLVSYFHSRVKPTQALLDHFMAEKNADKPNYPLLRRYFRAANQPLKNLLLFGLQKMPTHLGLLDDLAFFNQFSLNLSELISRYLLACHEARDLTLFERLVEDFHIATALYDYDCFHALLEDADIGSEKQAVVNKLKQAINRRV